MSFEDLPDDWPHQPLLVPTLVADVLDLVISEADRRKGALGFLLCDETARLLVPAVVADVPDSCGDDERVRAISVFAGTLGPTGSLHVAIGRSDGLSVRASDRAWARAAATACADGPRLLGVHVLTLHGYREVSMEQAAA